jgi:hypothetical protein
MADTTVLVMGIVSAVLLIGIALIARPRPRASNDQSAWMPAIFTDGANSDCGAGDAGCDGGGGGGAD